jgi:hypothetical protein
MEEVQRGLRFITPLPAIYIFAQKWQTELPNMGCKISRFPAG